METLTLDEAAQSILGALLTDGRNAALTEFQRIIKDQKLKHFEIVILRDKFHALAQVATEAARK